MTKGSKKPKKSPKLMPFKKHGTRAHGPKAAITQEIKKNVAFLDYGVIYAELSLRNAACDIVFFGFTYYNSQRAKSLRYMHYEVKHKI